ncbi:hypothetical protein CIT292_11121 [Citrobacter youngae ATCC 29220]|uniref:Uncharacterized protein n=1 Tax=Citrobacter youngae ATCC 29220 TaxID=500640 RepID=D4BKP1_9ENTR|nr:hypothetical protein CIT292_11121 [Citrobacter youngae ATCC 29220]
MRYAYQAYVRIVWKMCLMRYAYQAYGAVIAFVGRIRRLRRIRQQNA